MPASENLKHEVISYFVDRFGVPESAFSGLVFILGKDAVWAASALLPPSIFSPRPPGLRALRLMGKGVKPTSVFLQFLGNRITTNRVEIEDCSTLRTLLRGGTVPAAASPGYVAIAFHGEIIGCGIARAETVKALIPTGRRRALLEIIAADCDPHHGNPSPNSGKMITG